MDQSELECYLMVDKQFIQFQLLLLLKLKIIVIIKKVVIIRKKYCSFLEKPYLVLQS
jgi:hypothetical protein